MRSTLLTALLALVLGCAAEAGTPADLLSQNDATDALAPAPDIGASPAAPSDDPADWEVDTTLDYEIEVSAPRWVVPSAGLPDEIGIQAANNNLDIEFFEDRLFLAWRTAPTHFASDRTELLVVSSTDGGERWTLEQRVHMGTDMREPRFLSFQGRLQLLFFEAGSNLVAFEPIRMWRTVRGADGSWAAPEPITDDYEVPWDVKPRGGVAWMTSYAGEHYGGEGAVVQVFFKQSTDGDTWQPVGGVPHVYEGGASEVAFEFDTDGSLWAVTRNEDGDATGWGAHVCHAPAGDLAAWECSTSSDPNRYDSPEMFRHGDDLYLVARRDIGGVFGEEEGNLVTYSMRPKTTALYTIDKERRAVVHLMDLPGVGDTAFPAVRRTGPHSFLLANYTNPLDNPDISWIQGQAAPEGTQIYFLDIDFVPAP